MNSLARHTITTLIISLFISNMPLKAATSFSDLFKKGIIVLNSIALVEASSHMYGFYKCWKIEKEVFGNSRNKHTWNLLEDTFPSIFEMHQAEGEFPITLINSVPTFKSELSTDPLYLIHFVEQAQKDYARLEVLHDELVGNTENILSHYYKKMINTLFYAGLDKQIKELAQDVKRYQRRLRYMILVITSSYEYTLQRAHLLPH